MYMNVHISYHDSARTLKIISVSEGELLMIGVRAYTVLYLNELLLQ